MSTTPPCPIISSLSVSSFSFESTSFDGISEICQHQESRDFPAESQACQGLCPSARNTSDICSIVRHNSRLEKASGLTQIRPTFVPSQNCNGRTIRQRENSNMIQVTSAVSSLWRGEVWSDIAFRVKLNRCFLLPIKCNATASEKDDSNPRKRRRSSAISPRHVPGDDRPSKFVISAYIVNVSTGRIIDNSCELIDIVFTSEEKESCRDDDIDEAQCSDEDKATISVRTDPYHQLSIRVHQNLFVAGEAFNVIVEAKRASVCDCENGEDTNMLGNESVIGRSHDIIATDYTLSVEENFCANPYIVRVDGGENTYAWYCKCGGERSGIQVQIGLKDSHGRKIEALSSLVLLKTELVYEDGSPTPPMPLAPMKEHGKSDPCNMPLYSPLQPEPVIPAADGLNLFSFRINEVSFHHPGHDGFKLKVSPASFVNFDIHPGYLNETIVVLSKPSNKQPTKRESRGGRRGTKLLNDRLSCRTSEEVGRLSATTKPQRPYKPLAQKSSGHQVALHPNVFFGAFVMENGKLRCCKRKANAASFYSSASHKKTCQLATHVLPYLEFSSVDSRDEERKSAEPFALANINTVQNKGGRDEVYPAQRSNTTQFDVSPWMVRTEMIASQTFSPFPYFLDSGLSSMAGTTPQDSLNMVDFPFQAESNFAGLDDSVHNYVEPCLPLLTPIHRFLAKGESSVSLPSPMPSPKQESANVQWLCASPTINSCNNCGGNKELLGEVAVSEENYVKSTSVSGDVEVELGCDTLSKVPNKVDTGAND